MKNHETNTFIFSLQICLDLRELLKIYVNYLEINIRSAEANILKNSSLSLNLLSNSPCFPTMFMVFVFSPFRSSSYFLIKEIASFDSAHFLPPCSALNNLPYLQFLLLTLVILVLLLWVLFPLLRFSLHCVDKD